MSFDLLIFTLLYSHIIRIVINAVTIERFANNLLSLSYTGLTHINFEVQQKFLDMWIRITRKISSKIGVWSKLTFYKTKTNIFNKTMKDQTYYMNITQCFHLHNFQASLNDGVFLILRPFHLDFEYLYEIFVCC